MHEKKLKAIEARRLDLSVPGPGAYDSKFFKTEAEKLAGSTAFKTRTPRTNGSVDTSLRDVSLSTHRARAQHAHVAHAHARRRVNAQLPHLARSV